MLSLRLAPIGALASVAALAGCGDTGRGRNASPGLGGGNDADGCMTPWGESCEVVECDDPCAFNDPDTLRDTECKVTGVPVQCDDLRGVEVSFQQQGATVPAPGGFFKSSDPMLAKWVEARWQEQADFVVPANVKTMLQKGGTKVWNYPDGNGWTRTDFHAGILALPPGEKPVAKLRDMANDILGATGNGEFGGWVGWPKSNNRKVGDQIDLDIYGPDNGAVGYWKIDPDRFCVITLENKTAGIHPVNGIRCWGFVPMSINPNWTALPKNKALWSCAGPTYMFYTIGIDSPSIAGGGIGAGAQAATWNSLIRDLLRENDRKGGVSGRYYQQVTKTQPNALAPKSGVKVKPPGDRDAYYVGLPSDGYKEAAVCSDPAAGGAVGCEPDEYTCSDGICLPAAQRCDGTAQCVDRDDEDACDEPDQDGCPANQFACADGQCIPGDWRCDGQYEDCAGGEDEAKCGADDGGCKGDEYTCAGGQCIPGAWKCDGIDDCDDASDEAMCGGSPPEPGGEDPPGESCAGFACDDGQCIDAGWHCDEIVDCAGGEDEADCADPDGPAACDGFACDDGQCINASWQCDEIVDCAGGEDEASCAADEPEPGNSCGADQYACADGQCIPASWECDVYVDCSGGEDEASC